MMEAFKQLVSNVLENGTRYETNKGACIGLIGAQVTYDISTTLPAITGKKTNILWAIAETAMFLKGISHTDFLKPYGADVIWAGQGLSGDIVLKDRPRNPLAVIEEYAGAKGISFEQANELFKERTTQYSTERMNLDSAPPMMADPSGAVISHGEGSGLPDEPAQVIDQVAYRAQIKKLEDFLYAPFIEAGLCLTEDKVVMTKGTLGPIYGTQWRYWKAIGPNNRTIVLDQLKDVVTKLTENPGSRQVVMTAWNPANIIAEKYSYDIKISNGFMGQPPCHVNYHFLTRKNEAGETVLHLVVWLRSNDLMLGHAFNAIGGTLVAHAVAKACGFKVGTLTMQISDAHIYENHVEGAKKYLESQIYNPPTFQLPDDFDIYHFSVEEVMASIGEYTHGDYIKFDLNINDNALAESKAAIADTDTSNQGSTEAADALASENLTEETPVLTTITTDTVDSAPVVGKTEAAVVTAQAQIQEENRMPGSDVSAPIEGDTRDGIYAVEVFRDGEWVLAPINYLKPQPSEGEEDPNSQSPAQEQ